MNNKTIWTYWHQGFDHAPDLIKHCVQQWQNLHPDWTIHLLDQYSIYEFARPLNIAQDTLDKMILAHRSDLLRTQLLIKYGGVWADPTCFPLQRLDQWLPEHMKSGLFFFYKPGRDRIISNWFIAAEKDNKLLDTLYSDLIDYWNNNDFRNLGRPDNNFEKKLNRLLNRNLYLPKLWFSSAFKKILKIYPYMVYHFMLYYIISNNNALKQQFDVMSKLSADPPHILQRAGMMNKLSHDIKTIIDEKQVPLFKLTWKIKQKEIPQDSNLAYLLNQTKTK
jgi:hypothetical protein